MIKAQKGKNKSEIHAHLLMIYRKFLGINAFGRGFSIYKKIIFVIYPELK